jgi:hypothetical protein
MTEGCCWGDAERDGFEVAHERAFSGIATWPLPESRVPTCVAHLPERPLPLSVIPAQAGIQANFGNLCFSVIVSPCHAMAS